MDGSEFDFFLQHLLLFFRKRIDKFQEEKAKSHSQRQMDGKSGENEKLQKVLDEN